MTTSTNLQKICIFLAAAFLAAGCVLNDDEVGATGFIVLGAAWWFGRRLRWQGFASLMLVCFVAASMLGFWLAYPLGWVWFSLLGLVAALNAWNLDDFLRRWRQTVSIEQLPAEGTRGGSSWDETPPVAAWQALEHHHLRRLLAVDVVGLLLAALALVIRFQISFSLTFLLGVLAIWGLSRTIALLCRESD